MRPRKVDQQVQGHTVNSKTDIGAISSLLTMRPKFLPLFLLCWLRLTQTHVKLLLRAWKISILLAYFRLHSGSWLLAVLPEWKPFTVKKIIRDLQEDIHKPVTPVSTIKS